MMPPVPASMRSGPKAAAINARMTAIQEQLASYRFSLHPKWRELDAELERLKAEYPKVLEAGK